MSLDGKINKEGRKINQDEIGIGNPEILASCQQAPPEQILMAIFQYISTLDLVSCRLVCRSWNPVATFLHRRRPDNKKQFFYDTRKLCYMETVPRRNAQRRSLSKFTDLLKNSSSDSDSSPLENLPFTGFNFDLPLQLQSNDMAEFLDFYGTQVRHLYIGCDYKIGGLDKTARNLRRLLLAQMPNIVELELCSVLSCSKSPKFTPTPNSPEISSCLTLDKLKTLVISEVDQSFGLVPDILKNAPNLKVCKSSSSRPFGFPLEKLQVFRELGKIHVVNEAKLVVQKDGENLEQLEKIVEICAELKLKKLAIFFQPGFPLLTKNVNVNFNSKPKKKHVKFASFLNKILEQNKNCLESFEHFEPMGFLGNAGLKFPVLTKLQTLKVYSIPSEGGFVFRMPFTSFFNYLNLHGPSSSASSSGRISTPVFPPALDISTTFPNLTEFVLDLELGDSDAAAAEKNWGKYFPKNQQLNFSTIFTVRLKNSSAVPILKNISEMFPNCRNLHVEFPISNSSFLTTAEGIWNNFQQLENLELKLSSDSGTGNSGTGNNQAVDSFFTGFDAEDVETLLKMNVEELRQTPKAEIEKLRKYPSIIQLKKLRRLVIDFAGWNFKRMEEKTPRLSKVSGVCAFEMMNEDEEPLEVKIMSSGYDSDLSPFSFVSPYSIFMA